ncbi:MAG: SUMF1/EgtB/PvdO family nonheme iron enzyme [Chloroflexi bacterium]|nr:SUMF1/EgtB/PvdO family nonheme iron enzyme [Chloroflexota bacterium]
MEYLDFHLTLGPRTSRNRYAVSARSETAGEASGTFIPPLSEEQLENFVLKIGLTRRGVRRIGSSEWRAAQEFGRKLFQAVFSDQVRDTLVASHNDAVRQGKGLRLKLALQAPELADYPWEFLYDPANAQFLTLFEETPLVRYIDLPRPIQPLVVALPLRVLAVASSPRDYEALDIARERRNLEQALADLLPTRQVELEWLPSANLDALRAQLLKRAYHIFHFIGHGGFDQAKQDGVLVFETETQSARPVSGERLAIILGNHRTLRLAVLNACEGARTSRQDPFAGAAMTLVRTGNIPAVVAMQFEITDTAAIDFAQGFYSAISAGRPVDAAVGHGRQAIFARDNDVEWGTPVLYLRAADGYIFRFDMELQRKRAEQEQAAAIAAAERLAREKAEQERVVKEKAEQERVAREKEEQARRAQEEEDAKRIAAAKAESERLEREKAEQEQRAQEQAKAQVARERAEQERRAKEQAEQERSARDQAEQERLAREQPKGSTPRVQTIPLWAWAAGGVGALIVIVFVLFGVAGGFRPAATATATPTQVAQAASTTAPTTVLPLRTSSPTTTIAQATRTTAPTEIPRATGTNPPAPTPRVGEERVIGGAPMMFVPAGEFLMGSSDADKDASDDEKPQHRVFLDAYWMDKFEVTNAQYKKCVDAGKCQPPNPTRSYTRKSYYGNAQYDDYPVIYVSWTDAKTFCESAGKRLPTEAEWEKAARGTDARIYPWGNTFDKNLLNSADGGKGDTTSVGNYPQGASPYGVMDMAGNVWEWVADWYDASYYQNSPQSNPQGPSSGESRVLRGGSFYSDAVHVRAADRDRFILTRSDVIGFRCVA